MHKALIGLVACLVATSGCLEPGPARHDATGPAGSMPADEAHPPTPWYGACETTWVTVPITKEAAASMLPPGYEPEGPTLAQLSLVLNRCGSLTHGTGTLETDRFLAVTFIRLATSTSARTDGYLLDWITDAPALQADLVQLGFPVQNGTLLSRTDPLGTMHEMTAPDQEIRLRQTPPHDLSLPKSREILLHYQDVHAYHRFEPVRSETVPGAILEAHGGALEALLPGGNAVTVASVENGSFQIEVI